MCMVVRLFLISVLLFNEYEYPTDDDVSYTPYNWINYNISQLSNGSLWCFNLLLWQQLRCYVKNKMNLIDTSWQLIFFMKKKKNRWLWKLYNTEKNDLWKMCTSFAVTDFLLQQKIYFCEKCRHFSQK